MKNILITFASRLSNFLNYLSYKRRFASFGRHSSILNPLRIDGPENIYIGKGVGVHKHAWLGAKKLTGYDPVLKICDGATIGDYSHIFATRNICIGENVLIANFVYISDNVHGYKDIETPIIRQSVVQRNDVLIGADSWIGEHVCIIGASIGKHCVIGANSVVTNDIPDFCVAVGAPARIIKRYDFETKKWIKTDSNGKIE